jgi:acetyl-CoA acyltransferase
VSREEQDEFSYQSHTRAAAAQDAGKFDDEIVPLKVVFEELDERGRKQRREATFARDEGVRRDTSAESLGKLRPAFHAQGTITAGNASQMSDGAAAAVIMSGERARALGLRPMARFVAYATAGCPPEEMGIGPVYAIPKVLKIAGLTLGQIDVIELNEAFAAQSLAVIRTLGLDPEKVNINGGAIALGHPLGCTGAKLTATALRELERRGGRYAMVTMCVGGGMGAAGIFERLEN